MATIVLSTVAVVAAAGALAGLVVLFSSHDKPPAWEAAGSVAAPTSVAAETPSPSEVVQTHTPPAVEQSTQPSGPRKARFGDVVTISQYGLDAATLRVERPVIATSFDDGLLLPEHGAFVFFRVTYVAKASFDYDVINLYVRGADGSQYTVALGMREPGLDSGTLNPGQRAVGWVSFDAPRHGTLIYAQDYGEGHIVAEWSF